MIETAPLLLASLGLLPTIAGPSAASLNPVPHGANCTTVALTAEKITAGETSVITCFDTLEASLRSAGVSVDPYASPTELLAAVTSSSTVLAIHFDDGGAASMTVTGSDCNGGGISLAGTGWDNRISRTRHYLCGSIKHWDNNDYTGDQQTTTGTNGTAVWLTSLDNRTSSINYNR